MGNKVNSIDSSREVELNAALELMHFAYRAFTAGPDRILEGRGLQRVHHRILYFVGRHPGISVNGLLAILAVSRAMEKVFSAAGEQSEHLWRGVMSRIAGMPVADDPRS